ncbi:MAG: hypothetical protein IJM37_04470 [Lachnospiraceae bacterium]|nr:hypothetical protein [Lachnospiraceae bacterium]
MSVEMLSKTQEISIANALKELYYDSIIEGQFHDDSELFYDIESLVEQSMKRQNEAITDAGGISLRFSNTKELANAFLDKYRKCIITTENFAYEINDRFGYTIDLASVIGPYFLYQAGVTDETISFYLALGLAVANVICDSLASKKKARNEIMDEKRINVICTELTKLLVLSKANADEKDQKAINKSIEEIGKVTSIENN